MRRYKFSFSALACEDIFLRSVLLHAKIYFCIQCSGMQRSIFAFRALSCENIIFASRTLSCEDNFVHSALACRYIFCIQCFSMRRCNFYIQCSGMPRYDCVTNAKCTFLKKSIFYAFEIRKSTLHVLSNKEFKRHLCDHIMSHSFFKEMNPENKTFQVNNN